MPMLHHHPDFDAFCRLAQGPGGNNLVPLFRRVMSDQLTPVLVYRRLVRPDPRMAPSFLLESVVAGERIGRYSFLGAQPLVEVIARGHDVVIRHRDPAALDHRFISDNPLAEMDKITRDWKLARPAGLPDFTGGWVGFAGYDTVRYLEGEKLASPPRDDRHLPDLHMALYDQVVAFDHVQKVVLLITHVRTDQHPSLRDAYAHGCRQLDALLERVETPARVMPPGSPELPVGEVDLTTPPPLLPQSNMGDGGYQRAVLRIKQYIKAGDAFQVVPSQRFDLPTTADPFDIYRALRIVNPSPYMFYVQAEGCILVGSSPEILCRVHDRAVTNRPLAGTRRRGRDEAEDRLLEAELLADPKERAEHIMLVDLGRNDVGRVATPGSIRLPEVMAVERYSHVMHISSTVTGRLREGCTCWDALRMSLPVGTVSGAPKVRAMQIIDEMEPTRRGPYAGAVGYADFAGNMDMAIALRTMVIVPEKKGPGLEDRGLRPEGSDTHGMASGSTTQDTAARATGSASEPQAWRVHIQAGSGIVADSDPDTEHQETLSKAAALAKAVDLAQKAFGE